MSLRPFVLAMLVLTGAAVAAPQIDSSYWNSNWQAMHFRQSGNNVGGEYIHDQGVLMGEFQGDTLIGWWREYNNPQTCGPGGVWSGPLIYVFASDGKSFYGDWDYCPATHAGLDATDSTWVGTWRDSAYTESECVAVGRFWCAGICRLAACDSAVTETQCLAVGRFWCADGCSLSPCASAIRPRPGRRARGLAAPGDGSLMDLQGRCLDPEAIRPGGRRVPGAYLAR